MKRRTGQKSAGEEQNGSGNARRTTKERTTEGLRTQGRGPMTEV